MANTKKRPYRERRDEMERLLELYHEEQQAAEHDGLEVQKTKYRVGIFNSKELSKNTMKLALIGVLLMSLRDAVCNQVVMVQNAMLRRCLFDGYYSVMIITLLLTIILCLSSAMMDFAGCRESDIVVMLKEIADMRSQREQVKQFRIESADLIRKFEKLEPTVKSELGAYYYGVHYTLKGVYAMINGKEYMVSEENYALIVEEIMQKRRELETEDQKRARRQELVEEFEKSLREEQK